jgi:hypothetical protein
MASVMQAWTSQHVLEACLSRLLAASVVTIFVRVRIVEPYHVKEVVLQATPAVVPDTVS